MPKLMGASASIVGKTISNFGFSGKRPDELTATEYTLADIQVDVSGSVGPFVGLLQQALTTIKQSLEKSPRAENMLVRVSTFCSSLNEVHGFVNLKDIDPATYALKCYGSTALNDAALNGIEAVEAEGARLDSLDYAVNAVTFVISDGEENTSRIVRQGNEGQLRTAMERARKAEKLESLKTILVGVGTPDSSDPTQADSATNDYLQKWQQASGFDQYVWVGSATAQNIAKLANFVSRSVSSSSQSLGTGGSSKNLSF